MRQLFPTVAVILAGMTIINSTGHAQNYTVDFSRQADYPLIKTKFGVYQTPLVTLPRLLDSVPLLRELGVRDLRYEVGWGKPDVLAFDQISGTQAAPRYDFSTLDTFVGALQKSGIQPLLSLGYCPTPLQTRTEWSRWKDVPSDLSVWGRINHDYAAHFKTFSSKRSPFYEIWNEPDMPEPNGKMFFSGNAEDYKRLYAQSVESIRLADQDAPVGGPAAAWNLSYLQPILDYPIDFASIHGYDNYPAQIGMMRTALKNRAELPIFLTEYASFDNFPANGPQSRSEGAVRFFRDVKALSRYPDVTKVYWAQWLDAGNAPGMGFVTYDGHRKAIFNAFKIYSELPIDRNFASSEAGADETRNVDLMASSNDDRAGVVLWNLTDAPRDATVELKNWSFSKGQLQVMRIDAQNASYVDNPASENLQILQSQALSGKKLLWRGSIAPHGVVYLRLLSSQSTKKLPAHIGTFIGTRHEFLDRQSDAYADFDDKTFVARLGTGSGNKPVQISAVIENPRSQFRVSLSQQDSVTPSTHSELFVSFQLVDGSYSPLTSVRAPGRINLKRLAPTHWNQKRILLDFRLQGLPQSRARFELSA